MMPVHSQPQMKSNLCVGVVGAFWTGPVEQSPPQFRQLSSVLQREHGILLQTPPTHLVSEVGVECLLFLSGLQTVRHRAL